MNIYVGNLSYSVSENSLKEAFAEFGEVESVKIITDRVTGKSKGFGFVEMLEDSEAEKAIKDLDGKEIEGRNVKVNKARPRRERSSRNRRY